MASDLETLETIKTCLRDHKDFVLNGGAGSGKTHSLVRVINHIYKSNKNARVACITYTNVAADEIKDRVSNDTLWVSTIHEFLWDNIKSFQKDIKKSLKHLIESGDISPNESAQAEGYDLDTIEKINYKDHKRLQDGVISHNDVIKLSTYMITHYPLLARIIAGRYQYIFIDEYQDSNADVIDVFINKISNGANVIGLFGDHMQSIYNTGIGDVETYIQDEKLVNIQKDDNYRCSKTVINLINTLREDGLQQEPAKKDDDENILNKDGSIKFIFSNNANHTVDELKANPIFNNWDFTDSKKTKELYLTHRLIARQNGFEQLLGAFSNNTVPAERLTGNEKDKMVKHLLKIQELMTLYYDRKYNEIIKRGDFPIVRLRDKASLKAKMDELLQISEESDIDTVLNAADKLGLIKLREANLDNYLRQNQDRERYFNFYSNIKTLPFREIKNFYEYDNQNSIYSTQHGVKGAEFENVLVILDNGNWNQYNFEEVFTNNGNPDRRKRTKKLFYVACSRAENNLVVYCNRPSQAFVNAANNLFGIQNVLSV